MRIKADFSCLFSNLIYLVLYFVTFSAEIKVPYKDNFSTFGVKRFTSKSDKTDNFPEDTC